MASRVSFNRRRCLRENWRNFIKSWRQEDASSLLTVLVIMMILTVLVGSVLSLEAARARFVGSDVHELRATYAAEAALHTALASLQNDIERRGNIDEFDLADGSIGSATITAHGGYLRVEATGSTPRRTVTTSSLVGERPKSEFLSTLWIGDGHSGLNLAGNTILRGATVLGNAGLQESTFQRRPFTGSFDGTLISQDSIQLPAFRSDVIRETLEQIQADLERVEKQSLTVLTQNDFTSTNRVVVSGSARLKGDILLQPGTRLIVGDTLHLAAHLRGEESLVYAAAAIFFERGFRGDGQFLTLGRVSVGEGVNLTYPSLIYSRGETLDTPALQVLSGAQVEGMIILDAEPREENLLQSPVVVAQGSRIRGALYSRLPVHMQGQIDGSVVVPGFQFFASPTVYVNWLVDATLDIQPRPDDFLIPIGFSDSPRLGVLTRRIVTDPTQEGGP